MNTNWVMALDNLAASGVIDYDAPAFLLGKPQRYVGHPQYDTIPMLTPLLLGPDIKMKNIPPIDTYENPVDKPITEPASWKKWLMGGILTALAVAGSVKFLVYKGKIPTDWYSLSNLKNYGSQALNWTKNMFSKLVTKIKSIV